VTLAVNDRVSAQHHDQLPLLSRVWAMALFDASQTVQQHFALGE
jgi:SOS-response transcriptional repressor LexA